MRQIELSQACLGKEITALVLETEGGVHVSLVGGDLPHIGAVGIVSPEGKISVTEFPGHREGILCKSWCRSLAEAGCTPSVVEAGIHYDDATREQIQIILSAADKLLLRLIKTLRDKRTL